MLFRAIALSLALLVGIGSIIPFVNDTAEAKPRYKKNKKKKLKKYSKAWWRLYHKQKRQKRALLAKKRALRAKQILLARKKTQNFRQTSLKGESSDSKSKSIIELKVKYNNPAKTIDEKQADNNELKFPINDKDGKSMGTGILSVIGGALGEDSDRVLNKKIGGVATNALRRNVVDKIIKEDGWIVNDYHKIVNGKKVYLVVAQSSVKGVIQAHLFYFTEVNGRIYSLSTISPNETQERLAQESEKVIQSLQRGNTIAQVSLK